MSVLASAARTRTGPAFEAAETQRLYERYSGRIFGYCLNWLGTREEAEDATQTTFMNVQRGLRRGVVPEFEAAWLFKIAQNVCRTRYDRSRHRLDTPRDLDAFQDTVAAPEGPDPQLVPELVDALSRMPAVQRRALLHREWQGLTYREIAAELEMTESAVETLLFRARRSLAANLEEPTREGRTSRLGLGSFVTFLKSLLPGGGAAKVAVGALAVTAAVTAGGSAEQGAARAPASVISPLVVRASGGTTTTPRNGAVSIRGRRARDATRAQPARSVPSQPGNVPVTAAGSEKPAAGQTGTQPPAQPSPASPATSATSVQLPQPIELPTAPTVELPPPPSVQLPPTSVGLPQVDVPSIPQPQLPQLPSLP